MGRSLDMVHAQVSTELLKGEDDMWQSAIVARQGVEERRGEALCRYCKNRL